MTHQEASDAMTAERYVLEELSELERYRFEAHFFECEACAEDVRLGALMRDQIRMNGTAATAPGRPVGRLTGEGPGRRWTHTVLPWAAAASLALVTGYQSLVILPGLRSAVATQPLAPMMLHAASRGETPTIRVAASDAFVSFAADVEVPPDVHLFSFELRRADAGIVTAREAAAPPSGMPLLLLVAANEIRRPGEYILHLKPVGPVGVDRPDETDYRFRVAEP